MHYVIQNHFGEYLAFYRSIDHYCNHCLWSKSIDVCYSFESLADCNKFIDSIDYSSPLVPVLVQPKNTRFLIKS